MTQVLKRDGNKVDFNEEKISSAILKAMHSPSGIFVENQAEEISYIIKNKFIEVMKYLYMILRKLCIMN